MSSGWFMLRGVRLGAVGAITCVLLVGSGSISPGAIAFRPATSEERQRIAAEVRLTLSYLADSPGTGILHGTAMLLAPICVSTIDPRYSVAVATPFRKGQVGEPGFTFLRRVSGGYRVVGGLRAGITSGVRPKEVPKRAYADLDRAGCWPLELREVLRLRAKRLAPYFVI